MDKDKIQEIRDYAEAAANLMPYEDDDVIFSGIEIMELLDHLASKEDEIKRLQEALEWYASLANYMDAAPPDYNSRVAHDRGALARRALEGKEG